MPLNQNSKLILNTNPIEHRGGDGWTILHGDMLHIIQSFEPGVFDAVITDKMPAQEYVDLLKENNVELIIADE